MKEKRNIYEEIVAEYQRLIEFGGIVRGEKLPSCRALATERGINPNTVERAYLKLQQDGYIRIFPKKGAYADFAKDENSALGAARSQLLALRAAGATYAELSLLLNEVYADDPRSENTCENKESDNSENGGNVKDGHRENVEDKGNSEKKGDEYDRN